MPTWCGAHVGVVRPRRQQEGKKKEEPPAGVRRSTALVPSSLLRACIGCQEVAEGARAKLARVGPLLLPRTGISAGGVLKREAGGEEHGGGG